MKIQFIGATHEVTGSCTLLEVGGRRYLVDCGMEQGIDVFENVPLPVAAGEIEAGKILYDTGMADIGILGVKDVKFEGVRDSNKVFHSFVN